MRPGPACCIDHIGLLRILIHGDLNEEKCVGLFLPLGAASGSQRKPPLGKPPFLGLQFFPFTNKVLWGTRDFWPTAIWHQGQNFFHVPSWVKNSHWNPPKLKPTGNLPIGWGPIGSRVHEHCVYVSHLNTYLWCILWSMIPKPASIAPGKKIILSKPDRQVLRNLRSSISAVQIQDRFFSLSQAPRHIGPWIPASSQKAPVGGWLVERNLASLWTNWGDLHHLWLQERGKNRKGYFGWFDTSYGSLKVISWVKQRFPKKTSVDLLKTKIYFDALMPKTSLNPSWIVFNFSTWANEKSLKRGSPQILLRGKISHPATFRTKWEQ